MEKIYIPNINSKEEFLIRFDKFFEELKNKQQKTTAEKVLFESFIDVRNNIMGNIPLPSIKEGYANFLPFFEITGGMDALKKKQSVFWEEAIDLMYYFVQNY